MRRSTALFSLCGQKRKSSGEEILSPLPRLRAGPARKASRTFCQARKGKQQAFSMLLVRRAGGNRPSVVIVSGSVLFKLTTSQLAKSMGVPGFPLDCAARCQTEQQPFQSSDNKSIFITCPVVCLSVQRTMLF